mmetsp:Transcript_55524/g.180109  ORF Transcript_55524/g.180109 Transcript_55524/m.180109 type:complete len:106 (+) Transcript_55524:428-745(+)
MVAAAGSGQMRFACVLAQCYPNCCHFSEELCVRLGCGNIPKWVSNMADVGAAVERTADFGCCRARDSSACCTGGATAPRIEEVVVETVQAASPRSPKDHVWNFSR